MALCTLANVKTLLLIPSSDTTQDALLNLLIASVSDQVESYCNRTFGVADYTDNIAPSFTQFLQLLNFPIVSVTSVTTEGSLMPDTDYFLYSQYKAAGQIYRPTGWYGPMATRGLTFDPFSPLISIVVVYKAGYVLPGGSPVTGAEDLPSDLQFGCAQMVAKAYNMAQSGNLGEGIKSLHEGAEGYSLGGHNEISSQLYLLTSGLPVQFASVLNPYRRYVAE